MTPIRNSQKVATTFRNLQHVSILATHQPQDRHNLVEEQQVDWHEEDDPSSLESDKSVAIQPTCVLELKVPVPTQWSSLCYVIERCAKITIVWDPFNM